MGSIKPLKQFVNIATTCNGHDRIKSHVRHGGYNKKGPRTVFTPSKVYLSILTETVSCTCGLQDLLEGIKAVCKYCNNMQCL